MQSLGDFVDWDFVWVSFFLGVEKEGVGVFAEDRLDVVAGGKAGGQVWHF